MKNMKRATFILLSAFTVLFCSCNDKPISDLGFTNPYDVYDIDSVFFFESVATHDLLTNFGEENINFGPFPPTLDSLQFKVNSMDYLYCKRFIYNASTQEIIESHAEPPVYDAAIYQHHFADHQFGQPVTWHRRKTQDPSSNIYTYTNDSVYVIGHDSLFTVYYIEKTFEEGSGNPTTAIIISGTLVVDTLHVNDTLDLPYYVGVRDYIFGKMILKCEYPPTQAYSPGTIEIKKHPGLSPYCKWDTIR